MKYLVFILLTGSLIAKAQENPPNSILDISLGVGSPMAIYGANLLAGYNGNGFYVGMGPNGLSTGLQANYKMIFLNYGVYGYTGSTYIKVGKYVIGGVKYSLGKSKKFFLQGGIGYESNALIDAKGIIYALITGDTSLIVQEKKGVTGMLSLGYRLITIGNRKTD